MSDALPARSVGWVAEASYPGGVGSQKPACDVLRLACDTCDCLNPSRWKLAETRQPALLLRQ